jgi:hypothetical protein
MVNFGGREDMAWRWGLPRSMLALASLLLLQPDADLFLHHVVKDDNIL